MTLNPLIAWLGHVKVKRNYAISSFCIGQLTELRNVAFKVINLWQIHTHTILSVKCLTFKLFCMEVLSTQLFLLSNQLLGWGSLPISKAGQERVREKNNEMWKTDTGSSLARALVHSCICLSPSVIHSIYLIVKHGTHGFLFQFSKVL